MSTRLLAPILLFLAAVGSAAAVFLVQRIEAPIGPFTEPYVTQAFSPNGDGIRDRMTIRFTVHRPEHVTIRLVDSRGRTVHTYAKELFVRGHYIHDYPGTDDHGGPLPEGEYRVELHRAGDDRTYGPAKSTVVDTTPLAAELVVARRRGGALGGLVYTEPGVARATLHLADGTMQQPRFSTPNQQVAAALPDARPKGRSSVRFLLQGAADLDLHGAYLELQDPAGNPTRLPLDGILEEAEVDE